MADFKEYWNTWLWRDAITKLVTVNFIVWLLLCVLSLIPPVGSAVTGMLVLPAGILHFPHRPWTLLTYMFTHVDFLHLLANMLWLMLFGRVFMQSQSGKRLVWLYIYGGITGGMAFMCLNMLSHNAYMYSLGASCSVLAIAGAAWMLHPDWHVNLLFFGSVKLKWICWAAVVFFILLAPTPGQLAAHSAGLIVGMVYPLLRRQGVDILMPAIKLQEYLEKFKPVPTARPANGFGKSNGYGGDADQLDALLDKINRSGYSSLTAAERQRLFDLSRRK